MTLRTTEQNKQMHSLFGVLHIDADTKKDLVSTFSGGRTESSKDLYKNEADELIKWLNEQSQVRETPENKMRKSILACCHTMRWYERTGETLVLMGGKPQLDYDRIDAYCEQHSAAKKPLNEQSADELQKTVYQFQQMAKNYLSGSIKREPTNEPKNGKTFGKTEYRQTLLDLGINVQLVDDFITHRSKKRASFTQTALQGLLDECNANNFPVDKAIREIIDRNWQGFKYQWTLSTNHNSYGKNNTGGRDWRN